MTTWGVGSISFNMQGKVECDEDLAIVIQTILVEYAKVQKCLDGAKLDVCI
jgi:hypothetical protein